MKKWLQSMTLVLWITVFALFNISVLSGKLSGGIALVCSLILWVMFFRWHDSNYLSKLEEIKKEEQ